MTLQIVDKLGLRTVFPEQVPDDQELTKRVIQVGRKGRMRRIFCNSNDPMILPKTLGRHTGIRAWLANLELTFVIWKLDNLYSYITDPTDPFHSRDLPEKLAKQLDAISVEAYLNQNTRFKSVQDVIEVQIRVLTGADLNRISILYLLSYARWQKAGSFYGFLHGQRPPNINDLPPFCVQNGAQQICQQLVKQSIGSTNVIFNQPVSHISFLTQDRRVYITCKSGQTYQCHQVILAMPPNNQRQIEFSPDLNASKKFLMASMSMGVSIKFILTYKQAFWKESGNFSGDFISHGSPITWLTDASYQNKEPTLIGFLAGYQAVIWSKKPEEDLKSAILDQLSIIFEGEWALDPSGFLIQNWFTHSYESSGPLCYPAIGTMAEFSAIRTNHGPVHFAGSESAAVFAGTMAGAVHAGHRAAIEVLDSLRPQSLTSQDYFFLKETQGKYHEEAKQSNTSSSDFSIFRWTIVLPSVALGVAWAALKLRSTYGYLITPKW